MKILIAFALLLSLAFGVFSCSDKVVTNTTYQDTFRVPIHNSGLNDSLAYDKVYFTLKDATTKEILFSDSAEAGFVSGTDPIFIYTSSERHNLILDYEVIANGVVILSLKNHSIYSSDASTTLPIPYIADDSIIRAIRIAQNKVETYLLLRADTKHTKCALSFEPDTIDTVGTRIIAVNVNPAPAESCIFQEWEVESTKGSAIFLDSIHFLSNRIQVNGATGFLTANFLFPNELPVLISSSPIVSQPAHSSVGTSSTDAISSSSDTIPGSSANKPTSAASSASNPSSQSVSSSSVTPKIVVITHPGGDFVHYVTDNTPIEFQYALPLGKSIESWNSKLGATVAWKPGSESKWVLTVDYDSLDKIETILSPVTIDIATELLMSKQKTTLPARLYFNAFNDAYYTLSMQDYITIEIDKLTFSADSLQLQATPATAALAGALDYNNPYFHSRISFGKSGFGPDVEVPLTYRVGTDVHKQSISLNQTTETFSLDTIVTTTAEGGFYCPAIDVEKDGAKVALGCQEALFPNPSQLIGYSEIYTNTGTESSFVPYGLSGGDFFIQIHDVSVYDTRNAAAVEMRLNASTATPSQAFSTIDIPNEASTLRTTGKTGILIGVIAQRLANPGTFVLFGNRSLTHPEILSVNSQGTVISRHENTAANGFEYTGGVELPNGRILAWGGPIGAWATGSNVLDGIVALYSADMELIWNRKIDFQPFGAEKLPNGSYLVAGFANTLAASEVLYQQIGVNGE